MKYVFRAHHHNEFLRFYQQRRLRFYDYEHFKYLKLPLLEQLMHYSIEKCGLRLDFTEAEEVRLKDNLPKATSSEGGPLIWFLQFCIGEFSSDPGVWEILARSYPKHMDTFMFHAVLVGSDDVFDCVVSLKDFNAFAYERSVHTYFSAIESSSLSGAQKRRRRGVIHELQDHLVSQSDSRTLRVHPGRQDFRLGGALELPELKDSDASSSYQLIEDASEDARASITRFFQLLTWLRQRGFSEIAAKLQSNPSLKKDLKIHDSCVTSLSVLCHALSVALEDDAQCEEVTVGDKPVRRLKAHKIFIQSDDIKQLSYCEEGVRKTLGSLTQHVVPFYQALFMRIRDSLLAQWAKRYGIKANMETHIDEALIYALCGIDHPFAYRKDSSRLSVAKIHLTSLARQLMSRYYDELKAKHDAVFSLIDMLYENNGALLMPLQPKSSYPLLTQLMTLLSELGIHFTHRELLKKLTGWSDESIEGWLEYAAGSVDEESSVVARRLSDVQRLLTDKKVEQGRLPEIYASVDLGFKVGEFTRLQDELKQEVTEAFICVDLTDSERTYSAVPRAGAGAAASGDMSAAEKPSVAWLKDFLCRERDKITEEDLVLLSRLLDAPDRLSLIKASLGSLKPGETEGAIQAASLLVCDANGRNLYRTLASDPYESEWLLGGAWERESGMIVLNDQEYSVLYSCLASTKDELRAQVDFETEQLLHAPGTISFWLGYLKHDARYDELLEELLIYVSGQGKLYRFKSFSDLLSAFKSSSKTRAAFVESFLEARLKAQKELEAWPIYLKTMNLLGRSLSDEGLSQCIELFEGDSSSSISDEAYVEFFRATQSMSQEGRKSLMNFSGRVLRRHGAGLSAVARRVFETILHRYSLRDDELSLEQHIDALYREYCQLLSEYWSSECMLLLDFVARSLSGLSVHKGFAKAKENALRACVDPLKRLRLCYLFGLRKETVDDEFKAALYTFVRSLDFTDIAEKQKTKESVYLIRNVVDSTQADELLMPWVSGFHIDAVNDLIMLIRLLVKERLSDAIFTQVMSKCRHNFIGTPRDLAAVIKVLGGQEISVERLRMISIPCSGKLIENTAHFFLVLEGLGGEKISIEHLNWVSSQCVDPLIKNGDQLSFILKNLGKEKISYMRLAWVLTRCAVKPIKTLRQFLDVIKMLGGSEISKSHLDWVLAKCADNLIKTGYDLSSVIKALGGKDISDAHLEWVLGQCEVDVINNADILTRVIDAFGGKDISDAHWSFVVLCLVIDQWINDEQGLFSVIRALGEKNISENRLRVVLSLCVTPLIKSGRVFTDVVKVLAGENISRESIPAAHLDWLLSLCADRWSDTDGSISFVMGLLSDVLNLDHLKIILSKINVGLFGYFLGRVQDAEHRCELFREACGIERFRQRIEGEYLSQCRCSFFNAMSRGNMPELGDMIDRATQNPGGASDRTLSRFNVLVPRR